MVGSEGSSREKERENEAGWGRDVARKRKTRLESLVDCIGAEIRRKLFSFTNSNSMM